MSVDQGQNSPHVLAEGLVDLLEDGEASRRKASGGDQRKQEAAAERARKAMKANRDKKTGRKAAEDALQEDSSGMHASACALHPATKLAAALVCTAHSIMQVAQYTAHQLSTPDSHAWHIA